MGLHEVCRITNLHSKSDTCLMLMVILAGELVAVPVHLMSLFNVGPLPQKIPKSKKNSESRSTNPLQSKCMHDESVEPELYSFYKKLTIYLG